MSGRCKALTLAVLSILVCVVGCQAACTAWPLAAPDESSKMLVDSSVILSFVIALELGPAEY